MKKVLLSALLGASMVANAAVTFEFSYGEGDMYYTGAGNTAQTYDVAIFLPGDEFAGCKIKEIAAPLYTPSGTTYFADMNLWLSSKLQLSAGKNNPDIATYVADTETQQGITVLDKELTEDYTIPETGVYVGYSFTITRYNTATQYPLLIHEGSNPNGMFVHTTAAVTSWTNIAELQGFISPMIVVLETESLPEQSVSFGSVPELSLASYGEDMNIPVTLKSTSTNDVTSIDFDYTFAGQSGTYHYVLPTPVPAGYATSFEANVVLPAQNTSLKENVELTISKVNGKENPAEDNKATVSVAVVKTAPTRRVLLEEYTGTWCQYCPRGFASLEYLSKNYPNAVLAAYHVGYSITVPDPMEVTDELPVSISGFPSCSLNRESVMDPYSGTGRYADLKLPILGDLDDANSIQTPWGVEVDYTWSGDNLLTANTTVTNVLGYDNGNYRVGYLLVCDCLSGDGKYWAQSNYYYSTAQSADMIDEFNNFCSKGIYGKSTVKGLKFNDVVISVEGYTGVAGSLPTSFVAETEVKHSQTWDLSQISEELISDKNNLRVIAFVVDSKGAVHNCAQKSLNPGSVDTGVDGVAVDENAPVEYYNLSGMKVSNPQGGIFIRRQGATATKVVID